MSAPGTGDSNKAANPLSPLNIVVAVVLIAGALFYMRPETDTGEPAESPVLFSLEGNDYRSEDLPLKYSQRLYQSELSGYQVKQQIINAAVVEAYIEQQLEKSGEPREALIRRLFPQTAPDEQAIRQFYQQNEARISVPLEQARKEIATLLIAREQQRQQQQLIAKLSALDELSINLTEPVAPFATLDTAGFPAKGPADAPVTLVEFADYQCPHCKRAHQQMSEILAPWRDRIRYVFMDFPINSSGISRKVAQGAVCADQQGKFWQYQDLAFEHQQQLSAESPRKLAEQAQLELTAFDSCYASEQPAARVKHAEQQAISAGVTGTPSYFINGKKLLLRNFRSDLEQQIKEALEVSGV